MKSRTDDWVVLANAAIQARDGLREALAECEPLQRAIGTDLDTLEHLDRVRGAVLAAVNTLRVALKDRATVRVLLGGPKRAGDLMAPSL
jgi:hypothetical protein